MFLKNVILISAAAVLASCSANQPAPLVNNIPDSKPGNNIKPGTVINDGIFAGRINLPGKGAEITVVLSFAEQFNTKANSNGTPSRKVSDIASAKLFLTTSATDPLATGALLFSSGSLSFSGTAKTYTFSNVPAGGPYFVAVELFDAVNASLIEPISYGPATGLKGLTVSSAPVASVTVDSNNVVSPGSNLTIFPILKAGVGATIGTDISPANGSDPTTSGITAS